MLEYLHIRNLALIEDMELEFDRGMNVLTGETGAGKSFILKALGFLLGDRLKADMVRPGADRAHVEALFRLSAPLEGEDDPAAGDADGSRADGSAAEGAGRELILRRDLMASGRSRLTVNGELRPQEHARALREHLVSYTSQHGQQRLLQPAFQDRLMERFMDRPDLLERRDGLVAAVAAVRAEMKAIGERRARLLELRDLLEMQQAEIDKVDPQPGEEEALEEARARARRCEEATKDYETALDMLYGGRDGGLADRLAEFHRHLEHMAEQDPDLREDAESVRALCEELGRLGTTLRHPPVDEDAPRDIEAVEKRLYELSSLKRKLRRDMEGIFNLRQEIEEKISFLDVCELKLKELRRREAELLEEGRAAVADIVPVRRAACGAFASALVDRLKGLGFGDSVRVIPEFRPKKLCEGLEDEAVRILWAPNPGQPPQPLDRIASGGELSRFLLALASVVAVSPDATYIFDEVDSGVGGVTLNFLADRLDELAKDHQMLLVTHWPQIAARADRHFHIRKVVRDGRTYTLCAPLEGEALREELVRMGGGGAQGEALAHALGSRAG